MFYAAIQSVFPGTLLRIVPLLLEGDAHFGMVDPFLIDQYLEAPHYRWPLVFLGEP